MRTLQDWVFDEDDKLHMLNVWGIDLLKAQLRAIDHLSDNEFFYADKKEAAIKGDVLRLVTTARRQLEDIEKCIDRLDLEFDLVPRETEIEAKNERSPLCGVPRTKNGAKLDAMLEKTED